jgi:hypothetical protein
VRRSSHQAPYDFEQAFEMLAKLSPQMLLVLSSGVFISAVIFVWSYILTILASGNYEQFMSALLVVSF